MSDDTRKLIERAIEKVWRDTARAVAKLERDKDRIRICAEYDLDQYSQERIRKEYDI